MSQIKAILFDFDGTLADTNALIIRTFEETLAQLLPERTFGREEILNFIGPTLEQTGCALFGGNGKSFTTLYRRINAKYHDDMISAYPGVVDMVAELKTRGYKLAIVSSKKRDFLIRGMKCVGLYPYFDYILGGDDVVHPKPDPEPVLKAVNHFGLKPTDCLMVGDNEHDIESAQAAGVISVGVSWALKGVAHLQKYNPDHILHNANDLLELVSSSATKQIS